jgi:hypothetical protein
MPRPTQLLETTLDRSYYEDDGELDLSYLEELKSARQEILRTPLKHSFAVEPLDTIARLENLKKDIVRSPIGTLYVLPWLIVNSLSRHVICYDGKKGTK